MIEVRPARPEELVSVGALTVRAYAADGHVTADDGYRDQLADATTRAEQAQLWVAAEGGALLATATVAAAGTAFAEVARPGELEVRMLATDPPARGRGAGHALVTAVLERARALGCTAVVMSTMPAMVTAHRLYARHGFVAAPERSWEPEPGLVLHVLVRALG